MVAIGLAILNPSLDGRGSSSPAAMTLDLPCPVCSAEEVLLLKGPPCPDRGWPFLVKNGNGEEMMRHCRETDPWNETDKK